MTTASSHERLIFVHGSGDSASAWKPLRALLTEWQSLAVDLPGHGARVAEPGPEEMSARNYAEDVYRTLADQGIDGGVIVGHSLGGAIALRLAVDHPDFARRIVLVGSGARLRVAPALLEQARADGPEAGKAIAALAFAPNHEAQMRAYFRAQAPLAPGMLYRDLAACDAFDMMAELDAINQPALMIVGAEDRLTPLKYAEFLGQRLATATLVIVPDAGHYVQVEQPSAVANALREWLK